MAFTQCALLLFLACHTSRIHATRGHYPHLQCTICCCLERMRRWLLRLASGTDCFLQQSGNIATYALITPEYRYHTPIFGLPMRPLEGTALLPGWGFLSSGPVYVVVCHSIV